MSNNEEAGGSRVPVDPEEHHPYFSMLAGEHFDADQHDEDGDAGKESTTSGAGDGNETTTSGAGDGNATSGSEAKRQRKERGPNKLRTIREEFTKVDPASMLQKGTASALDASFENSSTSMKRTLGQKARNMWPPSSFRGCTRGPSSRTPIITLISRKIW